MCDQYSFILNIIHFQDSVLRQFRRSADLFTFGFRFLRASGTEYMDNMKVRCIAVLF